MAVATLDVGPSFPGGSSCCCGDSMPWVPRDSNPQPPWSPRQQSHQRPSRTGRCDTPTTTAPPATGPLLRLSRLLPLTVSVTEQTSAKVLRGRRDDGSLVYRRGVGGLSSLSKSLWRGAGFHSLWCRTQHGGASVVCRQVGPLGEAAQPISFPYQAWPFGCRGNGAVEAREGP